MSEAHLPRHREDASPSDFRRWTERDFEELTRRVMAAMVQHTGLDEKLALVLGEVARIEDQVSARSTRGMREELAELAGTHGGLSRLLFEFPTPSQAQDFKDQAQHAYPGLRWVRVGLEVTVGDELERLGEGKG